MSADDARRDRFDRHALVTTVWLPAAFLAVLTMHHGYSGAGVWWVVAGFAALAGGFAAHIIVNAVLATGFTAREVALGLGCFLLGALGLMVAVLVVDGFAERYFLVTAAGLAGLAVIVVFYMVTRFGPRQAFQHFDVVRDNNPRRASRLAHRGGRR
ncbi:hypothetical protein [Microbaculum marinum]|uniref:Uncharacterized protein n=1 Tax=Microbaculum marinum TaxID=1764581 RepID=A0AAW9RLV4_9HYPH